MNLDVDVCIAPFNKCLQVIIGSADQRTVELDVRYGTHLPTGTGSKNSAALTRRDVAS